ncbi:DUF2126 domain-containing protein [Neptuniibacter sp.]|uniref:transglutaminase family protein n=1 Tax=Neptuniibacter sp. TaxID=1962643 RepID=UPI00261044B6|nr:transglutaminase family protein [Neptuniibacter sp.]MCP4597551.1 transglutaminase family protein [Neptuniibacter sp.]
MAIRVALNHKTKYKFDRRTSLFPHVLRLRPAPHSRTHIHGYSLKITPEKHFLNWQQDPFGNYQARLVFPEKTDELSIEVEVIADMTVINPFDFFVEEYAEKFPFKYDAQLKKELLPYLKCTEQGPLLKKWLGKIDKKPRPINDFLVELNQKLEKQIEYGIRMEPGVQTCEKTLSIKKGSCRDTAWLLVQILRKLGLAARFTSGYLVQLKPDVKPLEGPVGAEEDFTDLHAWCEVYIPGAGWIGLDPTSGLFAGEGHIPLACTPDPVSAAPVTGATSPCEVEFEHENKVTRIHEDPRVTKPYSDQQWQEIMQLGDAVDQKLSEQDVRLTMGGEPTFVSVDDMESEQWNTEALGADKLKLAKDLLLRLREEYAPGGLLHYGQGKWYPGEEIPRWALGCFWREDGEPLWNKPSLLARVDKDYGHGLDDAEKFITQLSKNLQLDEEFVLPAYEDALYFLWKEQSLPGNVDPLKADLDSDLERKRIAKLLQRGLTSASGFILPLAWDFGCSEWYSSPWPMKREQVVLIPGDSPMGFRLPLDSLPYQVPEEREPQVEADPFEFSRPLPKPDYFTEATDQLSEMKPSDEMSSHRAEVIRTALCVEPRDGKLYLFLPPITYLEHFLQLIATIEKTAADLDMPVVLEGYEPPKDSRLKKLLVTPDPGVIEVNIHPSESWSELVDNTTRLYQSAHECRLGTEKFMLDGRHTGTGGGNHITIGANTPADSPLLRRPDLLRSLITYWQHHPGLSYVFSGMFIGPTSQAPRVDEARDEMLYELEIAFKQMPEGIIDQPWLVDRILRNLLVDMTGNTHRAEFCIDKLYAPGSASGRQGLLEFRGFEMPPHSRMALVQALLIRSLIARFWDEPYQKPLARWGTELHDKFMLPHYAWADLKTVVKDLQEHGIPFQLDWLAPFEEFRYPHYGRVQIDNVNMELRWAIEPWHVLGEEIGSFGTSRYVDSSVERLQIKLTGLDEGRYMVTCNGHRIPLRKTGRNGEYVAGVRYRAWQPPSALHPTIGIHTPLTFDLVDTWNGQSIGGCTYHVSHQGGRSYDTYPVNSHEAEARRVSRYDEFGHTPGDFDATTGARVIREFSPDDRPAKPAPLCDEVFSNEYPYTLDLRNVPQQN